MHLSSTNRGGHCLAPVVALLLATHLWAADPGVAERGKKALESRAFVSATWSSAAYGTLWKQWQPPLKEKPANYDEAVRNYYGLHAAPYENGGLPMGLREGRTILGGKGIAVD